MLKDELRDKGYDYKYGLRVGGGEVIIEEEKLFGHLECLKHFFKMDNRVLAEIGKTLA